VPDKRTVECPPLLARRSSRELRMREMKTNPARRWNSQIETETRKLRETKTVNLLTSQTGKVVCLRLDCTDREFPRQCVEDAMYANEHNQTSGQRWLERRRKRQRWRYDEVRRRCTLTTEERRSVKGRRLGRWFPHKESSSRI